MKCAKRESENERLANGIRPKMNPLSNLAKSMAYWNRSDRKANLRATAKIICDSARANPVKSISRNGIGLFINAGFDDELKVNVPVTPHPFERFHQPRFKGCHRVAQFAGCLSAAERLIMIVF